MQTNLFNFGFKVGENKVLPAKNVTNEEGKYEAQPPRQDGSSGRQAKGMQTAKRLWSNCNIVTYNVESLTDDRLRQITHQLKIENVQIMLLQGTRSKWEYDKLVNE